MRRIIADAIGRTRLAHLLQCLDQLYWWLEIIAVLLIFRKLLI